MEPQKHEKGRRWRRSLTELFHIYSFCKPSHSSLDSCVDLSLQVKKLKLEADLG